MSEAATQPPIASSDDVKITLHWLNSSRSHRILWLLEELSLPYTLKTYRRGSDQLAPTDLKDIHPLGKAPILTISSPSTGDKPLVLAESANIVEYLIEHFGKDTMLPTQYKPGMEGKVAGETEDWLRYRYYMHYAEGSLMSNLLIGVILDIQKGPQIPFLVRPITRAVATKIEDAFLGPTMKSHYQFLESQLESSSGKFITGDKLTGADIMLVFPLDEREGYMGLTKENYPRLMEYKEMLINREAYKRATERVKVEGGKV